MAKTVLITGASRGIGAATARVFAREGWQVALGYRNAAQQAQALAHELCAAGGACVVLGGDVSRPDEAAALVERAQAELGPLDALVCNAGVAQFGLLQDISDAQWREVLGTNLDGVFFTMRAAVPGMVARKRGAIVTVSSMWGVTGGACEAAYSAAKAGVIGLSRAAAKELAPSGIRVNCVAPGAVDTEMNARLSPDERDALEQEIPLGRMGSAGEVASVIAFLCSPGASYLTGQVLSPNGGLVTG